MTQSTYQSDLSLQVAERIFKTSITGLWYIDHNKHGDDRGYFSEVSIIDDLNKVIEVPFTARQINLAHSQVNVFRGFHMEDWNKLITVVRGTIFCCVADIRPDSPTYKKVESFVLGESSEALSGSIYVTKGLGNSYGVIEGPANYLYIVDALYRERNTANDQAISLFDSDLAVNWPIPQEQMILSERDKNSMTLQQLHP